VVGVVVVVVAAAVDCCLLGEMGGAEGSACI
jgi:hypothetical protein